MIKSQRDAVYFFNLSPAGRADAYQAILALFVEHPEAPKRTLIHCDYVVSVLRLRAYAESIGRTEFNRLVATGALRLQLKYDMFAEMEAAQGAGGRTSPLRTVTVASKDDLIVGDHVVFWNHPSYDPLIAGTSGVWRLENAIVIDRRGGELRYQGHGYFSPVNEAHLIRGMLHHYNIHVDDALALARRTRRGSPAARGTAAAEMSRRFPNVFPRAAGGWEIRGRGFDAVDVVRELKHLTAAEAPGLISPSTRSISAPARRFGRPPPAAGSTPLRRSIRRTSTWPMRRGRCWPLASMGRLDGSCSCRRPCRSRSPRRPGSC